MNKKLVLPLLIIIITLVIIVVYLLGGKMNKTDTLENEKIFSNLAVEKSLPTFSFYAINEQGNLEYYKVKDGKLGEPLKTDYSEIKDFYIENIIKKDTLDTETLPDDILTKKSELENLGIFENFISDNLRYYKNYIVYPYTIQNGDYVWKIQGKLTPEIPVQRLMASLEDINGRKNLSMVYAGEEILFLLEDITNGYTKEDFKAKPAFIEEVIKEIITVDNNSEFITTFDNQFIYAYSKEVNGVFKIDKLTLEPELLTVLNMETDVEAFSVKDEILYFKSNNSLYAYGFNGEKINGIKTDEVEEIIMLSEDFVAKNKENLIGYSRDLREKVMIPLHGEIVDFMQIESNLYILSDLGKSIGKSTLYEISLPEFKLKEAIKINGIAENINMIDGKIAIDYKIYKKDYNQEIFFLNYISTYDVNSLKEVAKTKLSSDYEKIIYADEDLQIYLMKGKYVAESRGYEVDLSSIKYLDSIRIVTKEVTSNNVK